MMWIEFVMPLTMLAALAALWRRSRRLVAVYAQQAEFWQERACNALARAVAAELQVDELEAERQLLWDTIDAQMVLIEMQNEALCERDGLDPEVWFDLPAALPPGEAWHADGLTLADVRRRWQQPSWRWN